MARTALIVGAGIGLSAGIALRRGDPAAGETLDGEGGFTVYGKLLPARASLDRGALPIGLSPTGWR